jgi:hypothetical protein
MTKVVRIAIIIFSLLTVSATGLYGEEFSHIRDLFALREDISNQGTTLPEAIKRTGGKDLMTLERIFELNTSALTTIEAYFRLFKMALTADTRMSDEDVKIMNEWLEFINNQCKYDVEYLDAAMKETSDDAVYDQVAKAKNNVEKLATITQKGIQENSGMLSGEISGPSSN